MNNIEKRKQRHIRISLEENVKTDIGTGFDDVTLVHRCLPEIDFSEVNMEISLFGKHLKAPLIISAMTGGTSYSKEINRTLAAVAEKTGIGIGVGSQRIAIDKPEVAHTFRVVREVAPSALVLGNIGCPQISLGWGVEEAQICVDMIKADALSVHMNPLQEAIQVGGDTNYKGVLDKIKNITENLNVPIVMKETGAGIAHEEAEKLEAAGVAGLEISGVGGTSWAAVEHHIAREIEDSDMEFLGKALWNWGIPTAISVAETSLNTNLQIIASGGMRTGLDMAKAIALGADAVGMALPFLAEAVKGEKDLLEFIRKIVLEFRTVMFLVGARNIEELKKVPAVITGRTAEWLKLRGFDPEDFSFR